MLRASNDDGRGRNGSLQTRSDTHSAARNRREQHDMGHVRSPVSNNALPPPGEGSGRGFSKQQQLCRSCVSPAQGCGRSTLPWVNAPTNLATLQELRLAVGVILNLIVSACPFLLIILLRVTPSAKRNSYRVATPYYICTQGRGAAHLNPGL